MKDPAFLFYSQDFYSGTRLMLPNERACYIDLLIYQHQNNFIPNDLDRVLMFCSGINKATLKATLKAKFKKSDSGWYNERLKNIIIERKEFKNKLSNSGKIGQFWEKIKVLINHQDYNKIRQSLEYKTKDEMFELISKVDYNNKEKLQGWLKGWLKHIEDENEDKDEDKPKKYDFSVFSSQIIKLSTRVIKLFPEIIVKDLTNKQKYDWVTTLDKLNRIDELSIFEIEKIIKFGRESDFWSSNFLSVLKLRKNNKDGIKYFIVFQEQMKKKKNTGAVTKESICKNPQNYPDRLKWKT